MLRPIVLSTIAIALTLYLYIKTPYISRTFMSSPPTWSSPYSGWHTRATAHPNPHAFTPTREALKLAVLRNAQVEQEGFTLALFTGDKGEERVAVDFRGKVLLPTQADFDGILELAQRTLALPKTENFRNTWVVAQPRTGQPIERILVPASYGGEFKETSVQGFDKSKVALKEPVEGITDLPDVLWELTGLALEARDGDGEKDDVVLDRVRGILRNVF
ncbi:hypothetical protein BDQ12DRAFT_682630 [Crucibulum laeve]|uniref:Uncharacterized protein n=1 Tax=Crucibulum laeve TaxID=68775 RepID=A0A5C3M0G3_9AGAR|nr:hypothetical protein BDQ12DRAFT_682630 [Crucibulum laeve]